MQKNLEEETSSPHLLSLTSDRRCGATPKQKNKATSTVDRVIVNFNLFNQRQSY